MMPSPFPGMDPYIETSGEWTDFRQSLIDAIHTQMNAKLQGPYIATDDWFFWCEDESADEVWQIAEPDLNAMDTTPTKARLMPPVTAVLRRSQREQRYIRIFDRSNGQTHTIIEVLSLANKTMRLDGQAYRLKREEYMVSRVNFVEIDLLRWGYRPFLGNPAPPVSDYYVLVSRVWEAPQVGIWPISVRDPLPPIPVPIQEDLDDIFLVLRACLDQAYDERRYPKLINYSMPPTLLFREPDAAWARELLNRMNSTNPPPTAGASQ
jgi:hypothetical protein